MRAQGSIVVVLLLRRLIGDDEDARWVQYFLYVRGALLIASFLKTGRPEIDWALLLLFQSETTYNITCLLAELRGKWDIFSSRLAVFLY